MFELSIILFFNFLIICASAKEKTDSAETTTLSTKTTTQEETNALLKSDAPTETKNEKEKLILLRNASLAKETIAKEELAEIKSNEALPLVLFPIFNEKKQANVLKFPQNINHGLVLNKRLVEGTKFVIRTENQNIREIFFCPKQTSEEKCLAPQKFQKFQKLECAEEAIPIVQPLNKKTTKCGPAGIGTAYEVIYNICPNDSEEESHQYETTQVQFYKFCYHSQTQSILHTSHIIISPELLYSNLLYRERNVNYDIMMADKLTPSKFENLENSSIKEKSEPITHPTKSEYKLQKLVPSEDMAFALWVKTTNEYVNTEWQHETLTPFWNQINNYVKKEAIQNAFSFSQTLYHVETAVIDTKSTKDDNQMSNIWVKMIYTTPLNPSGDGFLQGMVIFMNNFFINVEDKSMRKDTTKNDGSKNDSTIDTTDDPTTAQSTKENESENLIVDTTDNSATEIRSRENELEKYCPEDNWCSRLDEQFKAKGGRARCCSINDEILLDIFGISNFKTNMPKSPVLHISGIW